ncbi:hypothetical protein H4Q26_000410 [Puccinia striiformis f. sp. tritici PST-130]|nr:hypothetical protein H4Q26_000410 [Puccinia striiformis f. sp. tritici PST-130]
MVSGEESPSRTRADQENSDGEQTAIHLPDHGEETTASDGIGRCGGMNGLAPQELALLSNGDPSMMVYQCSFYFGKAEAREHSPHLTTARSAWTTMYLPDHSIAVISCPGTYHSHRECTEVGLSPPHSLLV